jgi:RecB family exonuclease/inactivated superfamily I helicase
VSDLHQFRQTIVALCAPGGGDVLVVPTGGAARQVRRVLASSDAPPLFMPTCVTRDELYDVLHARLSDVSGAPRRLATFERDAMAQASAARAAAEIGELPFQLRPGLVSEMLRFYDHLRRQSQHVRRFEALILDALGGNEDDADATDRGSARLRRQTRFLAAAFLEYERRVTELGACDEHVLRDLLLAAHTERTARHVVVTVPDWIADPGGLFVADFDMLSRLPGLESLDIVCTESILESGFHERIHGWWPGLEEVCAAELGAVSLVKGAVRARPMLTVPALTVPAPKETDPECLWFTHRDREEELVAAAARLTAAHAAHAPEAGPAWDRIAVVFKRPLPYLYLAPHTLGAAGVPYQASDALPLAAEPVVAAVDLILDAVETRFARRSLVALLGSPHLDFCASLGPSARDSISGMNRELSARRYLGGRDRLETLAADPISEDAGPALRASRDLANELAALIEPARASLHIGHLRAFLESHFAQPDPPSEREHSAREVVLGILASLAAAHEAHHDPMWTIEELAAAVRRSIGEETFPVAGASSGVQLVDDQAARYGDFDDITVVGLVEGEWPERARRNIFYQPRFLKALGWPSEKDRRRGADARFLDLLASPRQRVELSTFTLDDEMLVARSIQLDEVARARLSTVAREAALERHARADESAWKALRSGRSPSDSPAFHGFTGPVPSQPWSVSALETYLTCPFKFFSQHVLKLEEEPEDEEVMDPRRQGQFVHEVFATFFEEWQRAGYREMTSESLPVARELFVDVVDRALEALSEGEAGLERTRLLGSPAATGLGEAVFRMEAERPVGVVERRLEHPLKGSFVIATASGPRTVELRGKADRIDLLADGTFRLIDYKLGWPPDRSRALQLPIYGLCAEQRLAGYRGQRWTLGEAVYLAFKGPRRVVPLFTTDAAKADVLAKAQQRLSDTIDAIERGDFPPLPEDVYHCETCAFTSVCRKDYAGDV